MAPKKSVATKELTSTGGGVSTLLKAALPSIPGVGSLPGIKKASKDGFEGLGYTRPSVTIDPEHAKAYAAVCGFPVKDTVALPYPHMLAFPLHMAIMTDSDFPAPAIGTVHIENSITSHRPIGVTETLDVSAHVGPALAHPKGTAFQFVTEVRIAGDLVWESTSTYLRIGSSKGTSGDVPATPEFGEAKASGTVWKLQGDLGRRYAAVSGDHNPIHLYPLTAKALGFNRQIAHGMWTMARCVAAIENRLPDAVRVDVAFKKPVFLPGSVAFGSTPTADGFAFSLTNPKNGAPHVVGATTAL